MFNKEKQCVAKLVNKRLKRMQTLAYILQLIGMRCDNPDLGCRTRQPRLHWHTFAIHRHNFRSYDVSQCSAGRAVHLPTILWKKNKFKPTSGQNEESPELKFKQIQDKYSLHAVRAGTLRMSEERGGRHNHDKDAKHAASAALWHWGTITKLIGSNVR